MVSQGSQEKDEAVVLWPLALPPITGKESIITLVASVYFV